MLIFIKDQTGAKQAMEQINSKFDVFIFAHYKIDMTANEIAKVIGIPRGSVITRYQIIIGRRKGNLYYKDFKPIKKTPSIAKLKFLGEI